MITLDVNWLQEQGIAGSEAELEGLEMQLMDELELRVGYAIAEHLTDDQIAVFEEVASANDPDKNLEFLEKAYPDYKHVVANESERLGREVSEATNKAAYITQLATKRREA